MILGCVIFYDDGPDLLKRALWSLKLVTDRVIAIDGAYAEFLHDNFLSKPDTLSVAKELADEVIVPERPWKDEVEKRNAYLVLKNPKDYYLMLDADEEIEGVKPIALKFPTYRVELRTQKDGQWLPGYYNRLFRHHKGMRYELTHNNLVTKEGISLTIPDTNIPICNVIKILHYPEQRPKSRQIQDGTFENTKAERQIILPANQKTPASEFTRTPVQMRFIGERIYRGFDGYDQLECRQNDIVYVSRQKREQLEQDFPTEWAFIKELSDGNLVD
jgi:hypothetical protein